MNIKINKYEAENNFYNEITSDRVFKLRRLKDKDGNWRFDDEGIFSEKIFGRIGSCKCGELKTAGKWCEKCNVRVIDKNKMPDYYVSLGISVPHIVANFNHFDVNAKMVEKLMKYQSFYYEGNVIDFDLDELVLDEYDPEKIKYGFEAVKELDPDNATEEWLKENTIMNISIPHPIYRPIIQKGEGTKYVLSKINKTILSLISKKNQIASLEKFSNDPFSKIAVNKSLYEKYEDFVKELFDVMSQGKKSVYKQEMLARSISGAFWAVVTNDFSLDEDIILIGKEFANTLYPELYSRFKGDIKSINMEIKKRNYRVLVNRPPTIGEMSIIAMKPVISEDDKYRFIVRTNPIIYDGLSADTDGDRFFIIALYSDAANRNADKILPSVNYIDGSTGKIRNKIPDEFVYVMNRLLEEEKDGEKVRSIINGRDLEELNRKEYIELYKEIGKNMWDYCTTPTVGEIAEILEGGKSDLFDNVTNFFGKRKSIIKRLNRTDDNYSDQDSQNFMADTISSNSTDISNSGVCYDMLMASTDDIRIVMEDCGSKGKTFNVSEIDKETYNHRIRFSYVEELNDYAKDLYPKFIEKISKYDTINVRTPLTCNEIENRKLCKRCAGVIKKSLNRHETPINFGIFSTLMITEKATQASLDSMNKGRSENISRILRRKAPAKIFTWEEILEHIDNTIKEIGREVGQARFYEIALYSVFYKNKLTNKYFAASLSGSFYNQGDFLGSFIYKPSEKNFKKMLRAKEFEASSIKSQLFFDKYTDNRHI